MQHVTSQSSSHAPWPLLAWGARRGRPTALPSALRQHACAPLRFSAWLCCPHYDMHTRLSWRRALRFTPFRLSCARARARCLLRAWLQLSAQHRLPVRGGVTGSHAGCDGLPSFVPRYLTVSHLRTCALRYRRQRTSPRHLRCIATTSPQRANTVDQYGSSTAAPRAASRHLHAQLHGISTASPRAAPRAAPRAVQTPWRGA